jgi:hypothetical protein
MLDLVADVEMKTSATSMPPGQTTWGCGDVELQRLVPERTSIIKVEDRSSFRLKITTRNQDAMCSARRELANAAP